MSAQKNPWKKSEEERQTLAAQDSSQTDSQEDSQESTERMKSDPTPMRPPIGQAGIYHTQGMSDEVHDPLIGQTVGGHYEIMSRLGAGGMSVVYLARHVLLHTLVALKIISPDRVLDQKSMKRFEVEARAAIRMNHHNIGKTTEFGLDDFGRPYIVMEYIEGTSLQQMLSTWGSISPRQAVSVMLQACDALDHAHREGVVHRDIKPANIIVNKKNEVKIVDFGIAKLRSAEIEQSQSLTATGEIFGSPLYMSPEQCAGAEMDERSDIYSLGCVLYEALNGDPPFRGATALQTLSLHIKTPPPRFYRDGIPPHLEAATLKALEKDPGKRFQTMAEFSRALTDNRSTKQGLRSISRVFGNAGAGIDLSAIDPWTIGFSAGLLILLLGISFSAGYNMRMNQDQTTTMGDQNQWHYLMYKAEQSLTEHDAVGAEKLFMQAADKAAAIQNQEKLLESLGELERLYTGQGNIAAVQHVREQMMKARSGQ